MSASNTQNMIDWILDNGPREKHARRIIVATFARHIDYGTAKAMGNAALYGLAGCEIRDYVALGAVNRTGVDWTEVARKVDETGVIITTPPAGSDETPGNADDMAEESFCGDCGGPREWEHGCKHCRDDMAEGGQS